MMIEAFSYHTNSRYGSSVKILIEDDVISVTGSRMTVTVYRVWLTVQGLLFISIVVSLIAGIIFLSPQYLILAAILFALHVWGCMGGTAVWELFNLLGHETASFHINEIKNFNRGARWARGMIKFLIPFYVLTMNRISPGPIISFEASDKKTGKNVVYALMLWNKEDAQSLENLIKNPVTRDFTRLCKY
jgi:hypothetical protein